MYELKQGSVSKLSEETQVFLASLVDKGGPEIRDYERFTSIVNNLHPSYTEDLRDVIRFALDENTMIGHALVKPFGYPGDFYLIDKIYQFHQNPDPRYSKWDEFFQNQAAAAAVRNRKDYFMGKIKGLLEKKSDVKVLILGSGPATDVYELLKEMPDSSLTFDLIDYDHAAIEFSMNKTIQYKEKITYNRINALRFKPFKFYDMVWSAGMFDYFKDKHFIYLIRKYINCLADDGEFIIGNFTENPTRRLMDVLSDWHLNLRTESDLFRLSSEAGIEDNLVEIEKEPLGINLFMKIRTGR